jgi:hypothetical protein
MNGILYKVTPIFYPDKIEAIPLNSPAEHHHLLPPNLSENQVCSLILVAHVCMIIHRLLGQSLFLLWLAAR